MYPLYLLLFTHLSPVLSAATSTVARTPIPTSSSSKDLTSWNLITPDILSSVGVPEADVSSDAQIQYYWKCETTPGSPWIFDIQTVSKQLVQKKRRRNPYCLQLEKADWGCTHLGAFRTASVAICGGYNELSDVGCENIANLMLVVSDQCQWNSRAGGFLRIVARNPHYDSFEIPVFHS